ncbi:MAG: outer membrane lipoprotein-sorting protein, partial [Dehalococcoidales bacterium]|nr:outer membrane lipoprotein-sorting protein [Dehalococcoidales bacterium]
IWYHTQANGLSKDLQKFYYPQSIKDVATLKEEIKSAEDRQYLYLPAAKKMRRVSGKNQSWVGSDLIYEDMQEIKIEDWNYQFVGSSKVDGFDTAIVEMTPKPGSDSTYSKRINYIRTDGSFYPSKVEFFDKSGKLLKELYNRDVHNYDGALYSMFLVVRNVQDNHKTELERLWVRVNTKFTESIMTTRHMEKPVERYDQPDGIRSAVREISLKRGGSEPTE